MLLPFNKDDEDGDDDDGGDDDDEGDNVFVVATDEKSKGVDIVLNSTSSLFSIKILIS